MIATRTPPRRRPRRPLTLEPGQAEPLNHELELALILGRGARGLPVELQHVDGWRRLWGEYRATLEPKTSEYLPGRRPFARYVLGELPTPPLLREPPLANTYHRVWVAGTGRFWTDYPEPYQRDELAWLVELGECAPEEYRQAVKSRRRRGGPRRFGSVWKQLGDYPLEAGRFQ